MGNVIGRDLRAGSSRVRLPSGVSAGPCGPECLVNGLGGFPEKGEFALLVTDRHLRDVIITNLAPDAASDIRPRKEDGRMIKAKQEKDGHSETVRAHTEENGSPVTRRVEPASQGHSHKEEFPVIRGFPIRISLCDPAPSASDRQHCAGEQQRQKGR